MLEGPASRNALAASPTSERGLGWLRARGEGAAQVTPVELFFDLVYVLAVTQLTRHLFVLWDMRAERVRLSSAELGPDRVRTPPVNIPARPRVGR